MKWKKILIAIICSLCLGCSNKDKELTDSLRFKQEFESVNEEYVTLNLSEHNPIKYGTKSEINHMIQEGTGIIYFGDAQDNLSRRVISVLVDVSENTDIDTIYYYHDLDGIDGLEEISDSKIPLVLFVLEGKIVDYHVGTIEDKVDLSNDELIELSNIYLEGVHAVLQDACDERC